MQYCSKCFCKLCLGSRFDIQLQFLKRLWFISHADSWSLLKNRDRGGLFSPDGGEESPWATPSTPATPSSPPTPTEAEGDGLSYNQRSLQRWEKDEELGELSTISPVLYANTNFPTLRQDYPGKRWINYLKARTVQLLHFSEY